MMRQITDRINNNVFFVSLVGFAAVMPLSEALVSVLSGVLLFVALAEDTWKNKTTRFKKRKILLLLPVIYLVYLLSSLFSGELTDSLYDLRKNLFFIVLPLAFLFGKEITPRQKRFVFLVFSLAVVVATIVALFRWKFFPAEAPFDIRSISLISHIRFSFQLVLAFWFFILYAMNNRSWLAKASIFAWLMPALFLVVFLFIQQSLTGWLALISGALFFVFYFILREGRKFRNFLLAVAFLLIVLPVSYIAVVVADFYDIEKVDKESVDRFTQKGNPYWHHFEDPMVENGHYVYLYICEKELRQAWNQRSEISYDSTDACGYPLHVTLMRYLTSKGLRKDAEGVRALTGRDVENIEHGIANVIFDSNRYSLYPRIYQTIWEYYVYSQTGNANSQSFSQRIEFAKAAFSIIQDHFWLGVGTSNWKAEFKSAFLANESSLDPENYASAHNQYLNYLVKFGMAGFLLILFLIAFPVIKTKRYKDPYFLILLVFMFFVNFADSNFETHMGGSFFVFFYCLFLKTNGVRYLYRA